MASPSPGKKWSSRFGAAVRRSSSILAISRPGTPSEGGDKASVSSLDAISRLVTPPVNPQHVTTPSPIAESPAREEAATEPPVPPGPSRLGQEVPAEAALVDEPVQVTEEPVSSPSDYVPPPVIDSTVGNPGAFTDDPEQLPETGFVKDPYAPSTRPVSIMEPVQQPQEEHIETEEQPEVKEPEPQQEVKHEEHTERAVTPPVVEAPQLEQSTSYFDIPVAETTKDFEPADHHDADPVEPVKSSRDLGESPFSPPVSAPAIPVPAAVIPQIPDDLSHGEAASYYRGESSDTKPKAPSIHQKDVIIPQWAEPTPVRDPEHSFTLPSYSAQEVWGGVHEEHHDYDNVIPSAMPVPVQHTNGDDHAKPSNGHARDDPFADPEVHIHHPEVVSQHPQMPQETHEAAHGAIVMPLPPREEVISAQPFNRMPSESSYKITRAPYETDETMPLLNRPQASYASYVPSGTQTRVYVSPLDPSTSNSTWQAQQPRLHDLGWLEYHLPDGTVYYVHPTRHVTTECNLRSDKVLTQVTTYLDDHKNGPSTGPHGTEMWLKDTGTSKKGFIPVKLWVDHHGRSVIPDYTSSGAGKGKKTIEEEQLDVEFRYWSFIEAHPAHNPLPAKAKGEALDVLNWAWTDRLLPSSSAVPAPFTQEECQELSNLLRSFHDENQNENGIQSRIVARILIRVAQWRQAYFRPNKPLPKDVASVAHRVPGQRRTVRRAMVDFLISCICLGIPYIFLERARNTRIDQESGIRSASPMIVIGACTCLVAAIVLSASVTFLSLPGLDGVSRTAGIVAILFAIFSLAATVVAIFRHKSDMARAVSHVGVEGLVMISRRSVVLALPLVFLAYSILGFLVGIILYSFRGVAFNDPTLQKNAFEDFTRWSVIGVGGALAGMFATSLLLLRR